MQYPFLPVFLFVVCAVGLAGGLLIVARLFNPSRSGRVTRMPYESGMDPIHDTHRRFDVRFHLLAIAFLVFDVELLFLYPWAVASRPAGEVVSGQRPVARAINNQKSEIRNQKSEIPSPLSPAHGIDAAVACGWVESRHLVFGAVMAFLASLTAGFVYEWRKGVFRWR